MEFSDMTEKEKTVAEHDAAVLAQWDTRLADYPKWCFSGNQFNLREGYICNSVFFEAEDVKYEDFFSYIELLKQNGFVRADGYDDDQMLYKVVNGVCRAVTTIDPFDDHSMCIGFFIGDFDKK